MVLKACSRIASIPWAPSAESAGVFQGFILRDPNTDVCIPGFTSNPDNACTLAGGTLGRGH